MIHWFNQPDWWLTGLGRRDQGIRFLAKALLGLQELGAERGGAGGACWGRTRVKCLVRGPYEDPRSCGLHKLELSKKAWVGGTQLSKPGAKRPSFAIHSPSCTIPRGPLQAPMTCLKGIGRVRAGSCPDRESL